MHATSPTIVLNTIKSTQQKRKQNTAKEEMRQTEDERITTWCRFIRTHSDLGCLHYFLKGTLYLPVTVSPDDSQGWKGRQYTRQTHLESIYHVKWNYRPTIIVLFGEKNKNFLLGYLNFPNWKWKEGHFPSTFKLDLCSQPFLKHWIWRMAHVVAWTMDKNWQNTLLRVLKCRRRWYKGEDCVKSG